MRSFSTAELKHYSRHLILPEIGLTGQERLKDSSVLLVGVGGLGCPAAQYLAAAGVGTLGLIDPDVVDASNLHRQTLYGVDDVGEAKVKVAAKRLAGINPHIKIIAWHQGLNRHNAAEILDPFDVILDGTDNFATRYLVNDACVMLDKVNIYASIFRFEGQVAVFNAPRSGAARGPNYRDLFPEPPPPEAVPNCAEAGVLGVLPGIIGSLQANEAIKYICGIGEVLSGKLLLFDALTLSTRILNVPVPKDRKAITELIDYESFCGLEVTDSKDFKSITPRELVSKIAQESDLFLLDVRETKEYQAVNIGAHHMPLSTLAERHAEIPRDQTVVVHCRSGVRSAKAIQQLQEIDDFHELLNLTGGLLQYAEDVDNSLAIY